LLDSGMTSERQGLYGEPEPSRALVPVEGACGSAAGGYIRPLATFIAQVLACRATFPDFRRHRRAQPPAAAAVYAAAHGERRTCRFERHL
jgi:tRNA U55 pseudouridine synthase TruB